MILDIILTIAVGKRFGSVAEENNRSQWGFGILGAVIFYVIAMALASVGYAVYYWDTMELAGEETAFNIIITIICYAISWLLTLHLVLPQLEKSWTGSKTAHDDTLLDAGTKDMGIERRGGKAGDWFK